MKCPLSLFIKLTRRVFVSLVLLAIPFSAGASASSVPPRYDWPEFKVSPGAVPVAGSVVWPHALGETSSGVMGFVDPNTGLPWVVQFATLGMKEDVFRDGGELLLGNLSSFVLNGIDGWEFHGLYGFAQFGYVADREALVIGLDGTWGFGGTAELYMDFGQTVHLPFSVDSVSFYSPEPGSIVLIGSGIVLLGRWKRRVIRDGSPH